MDFVYLFVGCLDWFQYFVGDVVFELEEEVELGVCVFDVGEELGEVV